jgi:hypothetical protein
MTNSKSVPVSTPSEETTTTTTTTRTPSFHFSFSKHGRVGKSTCLKLLIEYMLEHGKEHIIVDTDIETPNVAQAYYPDILNSWAKTPKAEQPINSIFEQPSKKVEAPKTEAEQVKALLAEQIFFSADNRTEYLTRNLLSLSKFGKDVLINVPANVYNPVCDFISSNNLHQSPKVKLFNWWVSNGSEESIELFIKTQTRFPEATHILVLNQGNFQYVYDWKRFKLQENIEKLYKAGQMKIMVMPFLSVEPVFWQSKDSVPYSDIVSDTSIDEFVRGAIQTWMTKAFKSIEQANCI